MKSSEKVLLNGNQAAAHVAYRINEACVIYPITPASEMSELVEKWSVQEQLNIFGNTPAVIEMQSEAGVAGTMHGALQTGSLSTTFTASQGLLLMMPNMFRIAGELTPNVIHVATRSVATHALSVFGDHSDIMAVRSTGYAFLGASSVQEVMDFALISQVASLRSRIPFLHFFDGFRTSHQNTTIIPLDDSLLQMMIPEEDILKFRDNALNPDRPFIRGTAQGPEVFFQSREATTPYYENCASIVSDTMEEFGRLTGRSYQPFEYIGDKQADRVIIAMGSACETIEQTVNFLNATGEKTGLIKVRLYRPFSAEHLLSVLPKSCKRIAVLDRTKEPGSSGEPLYLDVVSSMSSSSHWTNNMPRIVGGRYGLASKEYTPGMAKSVFDELKNEYPKNNFTLGITDDLNHSSLSYTSIVDKIDNGYEILIYSQKNETNSKSFERLQQDLLNTNDSYIQAYTECDYKKSKSRNMAHLRLDSRPIKAPYLIEKADMIICEGRVSLQKKQLIKRLKNNSTLVVTGPDSSTMFWNGLQPWEQQMIREKNIECYTVREENSEYQDSDLINQMELVHRSVLALNNYKADNSILAGLKDRIFKVDKDQVSEHTSIPEAPQTDGRSDFIQQLLAGKGNSMPVSSFPVDGTYPSNTSQKRKNETSEFLPEWDVNACTQCGACSMACPLSALRTKAIDESKMSQAPKDLKYMEVEISGLQDKGLVYSIQINPDQCDGCQQCVEACPENALQMVASETVLEKKKRHWEFFETISAIDPALLDPESVDHLALREPLFQYPDGDSGCGQAPYLKLLSQLFGDRLLVANATGSSSIFGGALPTTPWSINQEGRGPAWSNSLFEDNAEFGLGFRLSLDLKAEEARRLLRTLKNCPPDIQLEEILNASQTTDNEIHLQRQRITQLKNYLLESEHPDADRIWQAADYLVCKSVWIVGGDGWAYDVGFGGLDHAVSTGKNINILILDNEVYDNTGGQMSKSTPLGAAAKFAYHGKKRKKKDLGQMLMSYEDVYVASVAIGADREQTLKAFREAESYEGPSVIIAYCHSKAHGLSVKNPIQIHKALVDSGRWILYRHDPRRSELGHAVLSVDSDPPTLPLEQSMGMEERFSNFLNDLSNSEMEYLQGQMIKRFWKYKDLARRSELSPWTV